MWQGHRLVPYGGNNDDFLRVPGEPLPLTITYPNDTIHGATENPRANVFVFYRSSQQAGYRRAALHPDRANTDTRPSANSSERTWSGVIPASEIAPGQI